MEKTEKEKALEIAALMEDGKGQDVTVIDVSKLNSWTDYFVITTVTSSAHYSGLHPPLQSDGEGGRRNHTGDRCLHG